MRKIRFGKTGATISAIGIGTWAHGGAKTVGGHAVGWSGHDDDDAVAALERAAARGIDHWDTADVYGDGRSESLIGSLWQRVPRDSIFLASKVGWDPGPYGRYYHPDQIRARLERSLALLHTDRIDLYYLHHCDFGPGDRYLDESVAILQRARDEGKIRFLGLSDWSCAKLARLAAKMEPDAVQAYRNVLDDDYASSGLARWVEAHDAGAVFFSPLKHGVLLGKYRQVREFPPGDMRGSVPEFADAAFLERMRRCRELVERRLAHAPHPVLAALTGYLLAGNASASVLVGMRDVRQAEAAATLGDPLTEEERRWLAACYRGDASASPAPA